MRKFLLIATVLVALVATAAVALADHTSLAGRWNLNAQKGGAAKDSSGHGNDGLVFGDVVNVRGTFGRAVSFDGDGDYIEIPHADVLDVTGAYTIEAWVNAEDDLAGLYRPILFRAATDANDIEVYIQANSKDLIVAHNRGNGGAFDFVGFVDPPLDTTFHLAVTFDGTDVRAYYDGVAAAVQQRTTAVTAPTDTDKGWWIGRVDHSAFGSLGTVPPGGEKDIQHFKGTLDEVRIWNVTLTASQVAQHAASNSVALSESPA